MAYINFITTRYDTHEIIAETGSVTIQARAIFFIIFFSIYCLSFQARCLLYCLNKPTQNIPHNAICVELTGKVRAEATITVMAADKATENARI